MAVSSTNLVLRASNVPPNAQGVFVVASAKLDPCQRLRRRVPVHRRGAAVHHPGPGERERAGPGQPEREPRDRPAGRPRARARSASCSTATRTRRAARPGSTSRTAWSCGSVRDAAAPRLVGAVRGRWPRLGAGDPAPRGGPPARAHARSSARSSTKGASSSGASCRSSTAWGPSSTTAAARPATGTRARAARGPSGCPALAGPRAEGTPSTRSRTWAARSSRPARPWWSARRSSRRGPTCRRAA